MNVTASKRDPLPQTSVDALASPRCQHIFLSTIDNNPNPSSSKGSRNGPSNPWFAASAFRSARPDSGWMSATVSEITKSVSL